MNNFKVHIAESLKRHIEKFVEISEQEYSKILPYLIFKRALSIWLQGMNLLNKWKDYRRE
jgi:hypothetical protein